MVYTYAGRFGVEAVIDSAGTAQTSASVLVKIAASGASAALYTDRTKVTGAANPITPDSDGNISFYADPGLYNLQITVGAAVRTKLVAVAEDPSEHPHIAVSDAGLWVSVNGSDAYDGLSGGAAKRTLQAAHDALPSTGGKITLLAGNHTSGATLTKRNLEVCGQGGVGEGTIGDSMTYFEVGAGAIGITYQTPGPGTDFRGPIFRDFAVRATSGSATGGIYLNLTNNFQFHNVGAMDFTGGYGFHIERSGTPSEDAAQYGQMVNPVVTDCAIGLDCEGNALRIYGGMFQGVHGSVTPVSGRVGIKQRIGAALKVFGTVVQGWDIGIDLDGIMHEIFGIYGEGNNTHIKIAGDFCNVWGGNYSNAILSATGTAIQVLAAADRTKILWPQISSVGTAIDNAGTNSQIFWDWKFEPRNFKTARRTSGNITMNSTSWANLDTGMDLAIPAAAGDVLEVSMSAMVEADAVYAFLDAASIVAGSPVNYVSSGSGTQAGDGVPAWFCLTGLFTTLGPPVQFLVQAGDISSGTVTLRLRYKTNTATNRTLYAVANTPFSWCVKNLGPVAS